MRKDEYGEPCPETLGEYRDICAAINENSRAVLFLDKKIAESPMGRDEVVVNSDDQVRRLLFPLLKSTKVLCGAPHWLNVPCEESATQFTDDDGMEFCTAHMGEWLKLFPTRQARLIED